MTKSNARHATASPVTAALSAGVGAFGFALVTDILTILLEKGPSNELGSDWSLFAMLLILSAMLTVYIAVGAAIAAMLLPPVIRRHEDRFVFTAAISGAVAFAAFVAIAWLMESSSLGSRKDVNQPWLLFAILPPVLSAASCWAVNRILIRGGFLTAASADHCRTCGYDLRGSAGQVCPECGKPVTPRSGENRGI